MIEKFAQSQFEQTSDFPPLHFQSWNHFSTSLWNQSLQLVIGVYGYSPNHDNEYPFDGRLLHAAAAFAKPIDFPTIPLSTVEYWKHHCPCWHFHWRPLDLYSAICRLWSWYLLLLNGAESRWVRRHITFRNSIFIGLQQFMPERYFEFHKF